MFVCLLQCSKILLCWALCCHHKVKERVALCFSVLQCFTSLLGCSLCSSALPRLRSALCVLQICPTVHRKAAVHHYVSVLCAGVRLQSKNLCCVLFFYSLLLCLCVAVSGEGKLSFSSTKDRIKNVKCYI